MVLRFLKLNPKVQIELLFDDHIVDMVEQGIDLSIRMGRLVDSTLGARYLAQNPWSLVAAPDYVARHGAPKTVAELMTHDALICSTVQHDSRWHFLDGNGQESTVQVKGPLRSNNKSALLAAACAGLGVAALPTYVVHESVVTGKLVTLLTDFRVPEQQIHAVYPSPRLVPAKVTRFVEWLHTQLGEAWWTVRYEQGADIVGTRRSKPTSVISPTCPNRVAERAQTR